MALDKALRYAVDYWPYAMNALGDGRIELDNNLALCASFENAQLRRRAA